MLGHFILATITIIALFILFLIIARIANTIINSLGRLEFLLKKEYELKKELYDKSQPKRKPRMAPVQPIEDRPQSEEVAPAAVRPGKIFVFSAPSGAGKTTLINAVREAIPEIVYSISATTRSPRPGEVSGEHYFFMSKEEFLSSIDRDELAEWAVVHGHYYGTPRSFIDKLTGSGQSIIMDIDVAGKKKFDQRYPMAIGILILPPSMEVLESRLRARRTDSEDSIRIRLANARREMDFATSSGKYEHTIVNNDLQQTKHEIVELVRSLM